MMGSQSHLSKPPGSVRTSVTKWDAKTKTDVTPAILSRDFVSSDFCRATKSPVWHGVSRDFFTVAQLCFRIALCSIFCDFVDRILNRDWSVAVVFLFCCNSRLILFCCIICYLRHLLYLFRSVWSGLTLKRTSWSKYMKKIQYFMT